MFKSIQWKVLTVLVLLILSVMLVVGTFLLNNISSYYHNEFKTQMETMVFTGDFVKQLNAATSDADAVYKMRSIFDVYSGRVGIDSFRNYYILDGKTADVLYASDKKSSQELQITQNLLNAMSGEVGNTVNRRASIMDFAYPVNGYIAYVTDTKGELYGILGNIFTIIFWALLLGITISVFLGLFLSRTIIAPIASLTKNAEKLATGDFDQKIEVKSRDEIGQLTGTFNTMATELSNTLSEIKREQTKVETIFRFMTDAVIAFDSEGKVMHINPAAKKLLKIEDESLIDFDTFFKELEFDISRAELMYLEHHKALERLSEKDGRALKAQFAPFISDKVAEGIVVAIQDITEQQKLDMARKEFVANVSHELRTPLTTVKSYAETLLENAEENSMEANFLKVIDTEADRMTRLVKDLLTLSLFDYDKKYLNKASFDIGQLLEDIVSKLKMEAQRRKHEVTLEIDSDIPPFYGDRDRLEQVFTNIVTNAMKYTPDGGKIDVSCKVHLTDAIVTVKDNGIGIPKKDMPRLFERFYRVDKARSRKSGGTGLGLAIAKEIVEAHGGRINIVSEHGTGTTATIRMPLYSK